MLMLIRRVWFRVLKRYVYDRRPFRDSATYWRQRYAAGGNSGAGSYNHLAEFKAEVINTFVAQNNIRTVIEFGCGDGHQLTLAQYPAYIGFDISPDALQQCQRLFAGDTTRQFRLLEDYDGETAQLALSLDVVFHLVEDSVYATYMTQLFDSAEEFVIVYASNFEDSLTKQRTHVRHRRFTDWVEHNQPHWKLKSHIPNRFPFNGDNATGSHAEFFIFERAIGGGRNR